MKRVLLASASALMLAAAAQSAAAADLPRRAAPPPAPAYVAAVYNWTGFYVGGHVGWGRVDLSSTVIAPPGLGGIGSDENGFLGGGQVGFNYQFGQFVIGIEGDIAATDIGRDVTTTFPAAGLSVTDSVNVDWIATLTGRLGVALGPSGNALLYVKGGVAWMDWSSSSTFTSVAAPGVVFASGNGGATETGWTIGAGLEYGFTPNWSAKIEYNYLDFGTERTTVGAAIIDTDLTTHIVKAGINYRFGAW